MVSGAQLTGSFIIIENGAITEWRINTFLHPQGVPDMYSVHWPSRIPPRIPPSEDRLYPVWAGPPGAYVNNAPGTWSVTPLPAALPLFATGLGALGLLAWRRKRKAAALAA